MGDLTTGASVEQVWETPLFVLLAVVGGLVGALFNHINAKVRDGLLSQCRHTCWMLLLALTPAT